MKRELTPYKIPCLYCGKEKKFSKENGHPFWYCDCEDFKKAEEIERKIEELEDSKPEEKYVITQRKYLEYLGK